MRSMSAVDSSADLQYSTNHSTDSCARYICGWCLMVIWKTSHLVSTVDAALLSLWTWRHKMEQQWCLGHLWKQAAGGQPESYSYSYTGRWFSVKFMLRVSNRWRQKPSCDRKKMKRSAASWFGSLWITKILNHSMCLGQCEPSSCSYTKWFERLREKLHMNRADSTRKQEAWNMVDTSAGEEFQSIPDWETCFTLIRSAYEGSY